MKVSVKSKSSHALGRLGPKRLTNRINKLGSRISKIVSMITPLRELNALNESSLMILFLSYKSLEYEKKKAMYFLRRRKDEGNSNSTKTLKELELHKAFYDTRFIHEHSLTKKFFDEKKRFINRI